MDLNFLAQADGVTLKFELAKRALESAKAELEQSKLAYEEILGQAEAHGIPKAKLKKLTEDRVHALIESGMLGAAPLPEAKRERPRKPSKKADLAEEPVDEEANVRPPEIDQ